MIFPVVLILCFIFLGLIAAIISWALYTSLSRHYIETIFDISP